MRDSLPTFFSLSNTQLHPLTHKLIDLIKGSWEEVRQRHVTDCYLDRKHSYHTSPDTDNLGALKQFINLPNRHPEKFSSPFMFQHPNDVVVLVEDGWHIWALTYVNGLIIWQALVWYTLWFQKWSVHLTWQINWNVTVYK